MRKKKDGRQQDRSQVGTVYGAADCVGIPESESTKKRVGQLQKKLKDMSRSHHFSPRRERLIENLLSQKFKTLKDAIIDAGYAESTATKVPSEIIGNYRFRTAIRERMNEDGIDKKRLTKVLSEGLDATKVISAIVVASSAGGIKGAGGMTKDLIEVPDFLARHKFLETALDLRGDYPDKKLDVSHFTFETHKHSIARLRGGT
jgi:hypothetical protein